MPPVPPTITPEEADAKLAEVSTALKDRGTTVGGWAMAQGWYSYSVVRAIKGEVDGPQSRRIMRRLRKFIAETPIQE